jgi:hypothetical protein
VTDATERAKAAARAAADAKKQAAIIHRRSAALHARAADFYLDHAKLDRLIGLDELAATMEERAGREREMEAAEIRRADDAESR